MFLTIDTVSVCAAHCHLDGREEMREFSYGNHSDEDTKRSAIYWFKVAACTYPSSTSREACAELRRMWTSGQYA
jgi:hypothetical protein